MAQQPPSLVPRGGSSMAKELKIHHGKSQQDEAYAKILKAYNWGASLPPRGYVFGAGRGAKPLNSSSSGVAVGAGSKSEHGGLSAAALSYFGELDAISETRKPHAVAAAAAVAVDQSDDNNNNSSTNASGVVNMISHAALATMERTVVSKALRGSRDEEGGSLAEEVFLADDVGAEAGLSYLDRRRFLANLQGTPAAARSTGGVVAATAATASRRPRFTQEQLSAILKDGDESEPVTWIRRARALFDAEEAGAAGGTVSGAPIGGGVARSTDSALRCLAEGLGRRAVAGSGPHIHRERLCALLRWGHYAEGEDDEEEENAAASPTEGLDIFTVGAASQQRQQQQRRAVAAARRSLNPHDLLRALQSPAYYGIPNALLHAARAVVEEAVVACPSAIELWAYAIAMQPSEAKAAQQSQAALEANPQCVPLFRYAAERLGTFEDRVALVKGGLGLSPFNIGLLSLAASLYEANRHTAATSVTAARQLFIAAAGRFAREHASRIPPFAVMAAAVALEDRELCGVLRRPARGAGVSLSRGQVEGLIAAADANALALPFMAAIDPTHASSFFGADSFSSSTSGDGVSSLPPKQLQHLFSLLGSGTHSLAKLVAKTASLHLTGAIERRTQEAATVAGALKNEKRVRQAINNSNTSNNSNSNDSAARPSPAFEGLSLEEIDALLAGPCLVRAVRGHVVAEWVRVAVDMACAGNVLAGAMMLRELLRSQTARRPAAADASSSSTSSSPLDDYSSLEAGWATDFVPFCLARYEGREASAASMRTLSALVDAVLTQTAPANGSFTAGADEVQRLAAQERREESFISELLHCERTRAKAADAANSTTAASADESSDNANASEEVSVEASIARHGQKLRGILRPAEAYAEDGGASDALFGADASSSSSSAAAPPNVSALLSLMAWLIASIGLCTVATAEESAAAESAVAGADTAAASSDRVGGALVDATFGLPEGVVRSAAHAHAHSSSTTAAAVGGVEGSVSPALSAANLSPALTASKIEAAAAGGLSPAAKGGAGAFASTAPVANRFTDFNWAVANATPPAALAGLLQAFTTEVTRTMVAAERSQERQRIAEKALATARHGSSPSSSSSSPISTPFSAVRHLYCASHPLGRLLQLLLSTTVRLVFAEGVRSAQRIVSHCAWGTSAAERMLSANAFAFGASSSSSVSCGRAGASSQQRHHSADLSSTTVVKREEGQGAAVGGGGVLCYVPPPSGASAVSAASPSGGGASVGAGAGAASAAPAGPAAATARFVAPCWSDALCSPTAVPLCNATSIEGIAHAYVRRRGKGFSEASAAAAQLRHQLLLTSPATAPSAATAPPPMPITYSYSSFDASLRMLLGVADFARMAAALLADGRWFSAALAALAHPLALLVRFAYAVPLIAAAGAKVMYVSAEEEREIAASVGTALQTRVGAGAPAEAAVADAVRRITRLIATRRAAVLSCLMPPLTASVESLALASAALLQQSSDHQRLLCAAAGALSGRLEAAVKASSSISASAALATTNTADDSASDNANAAGNGPLLTIAPLAAEALRPLLKSLAIAAERIASQQGDLVSFAAAGATAAASASPPAAAAGTAIRALLDSLCLPAMPRAVAAELSTFAEAHMVASVAGLRRRAQGGSGSGSGDGNGAGTINMKVALAMGGVDAIRQQQQQQGCAAAAVKAAAVAVLPPLLVATTALLQQTRGEEGLAHTAFAPRAPAAGPLPSNLTVAIPMPALPPHLWPLLRSERLWHSRLVTERYYSHTCDALLAAPTPDLLIAAAATNPTSSPTDDDKNQDEADAFVYSQSLPARGARDASAAINAVLRLVSTVSAADAAAVPQCVREGIRAVVGPLAPAMAMCVADANAFAAATIRIRSALAAARSGSAAPAPSSSSPAPSTPPLAALLAIANVDRAMSSRQLWEMAVHEAAARAQLAASLQKERQQQHQIFLQPSSSGPSSSSSTAAGGAGGALPPAPNSADRIAALRVICDAARQHCPIGAALPKAVRSALTYAGGPMTAFADIVMMQTQQHARAADAAANSLLPPLALPASATTSHPTVSTVSGAGFGTPSAVASTADVLLCVAAVGRAAAESLSVLSATVRLWVGPIALDALAAAAGDQQAARGVLEACEAACGEFLAAAAKRKADVDGRLEASEQALAKEEAAQKGLSDASAAGGGDGFVEFSKRLTARLRVKSGGAGAGGPQQWQRMVDEVAYLRSVKDNITDAVFYALLRCLCEAQRARIDVERVAALGSRRLAMCSFFPPAALPANLAATPNTTNNSNNSSSNATMVAATAAVTPHTAAAPSFFPSALHRETLTVIRRVVAATVTPQMGPLVRHFARLKIEAGEAAADGGALSASSSAATAHSLSFADLTARIGANGLLEVASQWIACEVPRERPVAIATVMNRLMGRHPATYHAVAGALWGAGRPAKAAEEVLRAIDHSRGRRCDAWAFVVLAMREAQRLLTEALEGFSADVSEEEAITEMNAAGDLAYTAGDDGRLHVNYRRRIVTPAVLRAASARYTSRIDFIAEQMLRPYLEQLFGGTPYASHGGPQRRQGDEGSSAAALAALSPFEPLPLTVLSAALLPEGYANVGASLDAGMPVSADGSVSRSVVAAAYARNAAIARRVAAAAEACLVAASSMAREVLEASNGRTLVRNGGLSLAAFDSARGAPDGAAADVCGPLWSFVTSSAAAGGDEALTGLRWPAAAVVDATVALLATPSQ